MLVRVIVALSMFILCLSLGLWFIYQEKQSAPSSFVSSKTTEDNENEPFFYRTIGQLPQSTPSPSRKGLPASALQEQFTLEIAMLRTQVQAENLLSSLGKKGVKAYYTPLQNSGRVVYRVRQGVFPSKKLARRAKQNLWQEKAVEARIVKLQ